MMQAILLGSFRSDGFDSDIMFINCRFDWPFFVADMIAVSRLTSRAARPSGLAVVGILIKEVEEWD